MKIAAIATAGLCLYLGDTNDQLSYLERKGKVCSTSKTWRLWNEGDASELIDALRDESLQSLRSAEHPDDRPSMASVVWMLGGDSALPNPKEPAFLNDRGPLEIKFILQQGWIIFNQ
ncbi:hypothetical protein NC653_028030 [Populus alba x Populus x berolinensis]|uniref:Uncharacterized protein n=1 Tax=Populus alba x Populus x berolinensis TaxID=444605 RepID=A0AAD6Q5Q0_9ROSI|nr:hypothetical protein NC653_028030 [Populus alba x Populus x berolinensis]